MVCKESAKAYLKVLNGLISVIGLAISGVSTYGMVQYKAELDALSPYTVYAGLGLGALVTSVGLMGCYGASKQSKPLLIAYWVIMFILTTVVLALGVLFLVQTGELDNATQAKPVTDKFLQVANDFSNKVYQECCIAAEPSSLAPAGTTIVACSATVSQSCYYDKGFFDGIPVADALCVTLTKFSVNGITPVSAAGCASSAVFGFTFKEFVKTNALPVGITFIVLAVLLILVEIFTCVLICSNREQFDATYRRKVQQQSGGAIAGSAGVQYA